MSDLIERDSSFDQFSSQSARAIGQRSPETVKNVKQTAKSGDESSLPALETTTASCDVGWIEAKFVCIKQDRKNWGFWS